MYDEVRTMQGTPMDMFEEMDEMFARLFSRMDREFMDGTPQVMRVPDHGPG